MYSRQSERRSRAKEKPVVGGLPNAPGIQAAMMIAPDMSDALRSLADTLLVKPFAGATLNRGERELIAAAVSAVNDCFYCMDSHSAFAEALLCGDGMEESDARALTNCLRQKKQDLLSRKMKLLVQVALAVREGGHTLTKAEVTAARDAGATDQDVQLAVMISSAFCMYNRMVDGFRASTPADAGFYWERARQIAENGYAVSARSPMPVVRQQNEELLINLDI